MTKTSLVNVGIDTKFSVFPGLNVYNSGGETTHAVLIIDDVEQGRVSIEPGETKTIIKALRFNPDIILGVETCPISLGAQECIDSTGTFSVK